MASECALALEHANTFTVACWHDGALASYRSCSILPALASSLDVFSKSDMSYGVDGVLLAPVLGSVVFVLAAHNL